jgi:hypothetical protein
MEILGILADSYTVGGGKRRIVDNSKNSRRVLVFETYSPKAFASIKEIDPDLRDRCVLISMLRTRADYPYPEAHLPIWQDIRDKSYRHLLTRWQGVKEIYLTAGEDVNNRVKELWKPIETILRLENVPDEEFQNIKEVFLESMLETQAELTDLEIELFEVVLEMLEKTKEKILTVDEIAAKLSNHGMTDKGVRTWVGKAIKQFSLSDRRAGRVNSKRAYVFSYDHVKSVFLRYHQTVGTGGQVVDDINNQLVTNDHLKNIGGNEVADATSLPLIKREVVTTEPLIHQDTDHLATKTTYLTPSQNKTTFNGVVEVEDILDEI